MAHHAHYKVVFLTEDEYDRYCSWKKEDEKLTRQKNLEKYLELKKMEKQAKEQLEKFEELYPHIKAEIEKENEMTFLERASLFFLEPATFQEEIQMRFKKEYRQLYDRHYYAIIDVEEFRSTYHVGDE